MIKKIWLTSLILLVNFFAISSFAYTPTTSEQTFVNVFNQKIDAAIKVTPTRKATLLSVMKMMYTRYHSNERLSRIFASLINHLEWGATTTSTTTWWTTTSNSTCTYFPSDNARNTDISSYQVHQNSANYIKTITARRNKLHPDFGANRDGWPFGIPYIVVGKDQALVPVKATRYPDESDQWNFPVPLNAPIEKWSDAHVIAVDNYNCKLYELYTASKVWSTREAWSVAVFDMKSNALRPEWRTSADAAWLSIFAWLVRYDEVAAWAINHALRFTLSKTQKAYIHPATHYASSNTSSNEAPMGLRFRLKKDYDISKLYWQSKVIAEAMKKYGMIVADNWSDRFVSWAPDARWDDEDLNQIKAIPWSAFEVIDTGPIIK